MLTLKELIEMDCRAKAHYPPRIVIFEDCDSFESWIEDTIDGCENYDDILFLNFQSDLKPEYILRDEVLASKVIRLTAVTTDVLAVVIKKEDPEECKQ